MQKNLLKIVLASCGLLCAQAGWSAGELPSKMTFSPKNPVKFSVRIETSDKTAVDSCKKILGFYMVQYKVTGKAGKDEAPWTIEMNKEYVPPLTEPDKIVNTLRGTPCGTSGDFTWSISQELTVHEPNKAKKP
jgi:hypothetical protein